MLPFASPISMLQCRQDSDRTVQPRINVRVAARIVAQCVGFKSIVLAQNVRQAGLGLHRRRKGGAILPWTSLPIPAHRNIDDGRIELSHLLISEAKARERTGSEVLDNDIGFAAQIGHDLASLRPVQVETQIALTRILLRVVHGHRADVRHATTAGIAAGRLNLDHFGAQVPQRLGAKRASKNPCEVNNLQSIQWSAHDQFPSKTAEPGPDFAKA